MQTRNPDEDKSLIIFLNDLDKRLRTLNIGYL